MRFFFVKYTNFQYIENIKLYYSWTDSVKVCVRILWHVVVEYDVDSLNVHASAKQVGGNQDSPLKVFELLVP